MGYNTQVDKMDIFTLNTGERPREENFEVEEWVKNLALVEVYRRSFPLWDYDWIRQHFGDITPSPLTNKSIVTEQKNKSDSVTGEKTRQENVNVEEKNVILMEEEVLTSSKGDTDVQSKEQSGSVDAAEIMMEASQKNTFKDFNFTGIKMENPEEMYVNDILMTECEEKNVMRLIKKLKRQLVKDDKGMNKECENIVRMVETEKEKLRKVKSVHEHSGHRSEDKLTEILKGMKKARKYAKEVVKRCKICQKRQPSKM